MTNLYRDPVDVAIRYGRIEDSSYVALPLAPHNRRVLVASPDYLRRKGRPQSLDELRAHDGLLWGSTAVSTTNGCSRSKAGAGRR